MAGLSANEILMNGDGLVVNAFRDAPGRGDYFNGSSGTSEGQFLFILGMLDAYKVTGEASALEMAERALGAVLSTLYRNMPIPAQVTETSIFAPHWLFSVKYAFKSSIIKYNTTVVFTNGVGVIPSSTARYVYNARSVDATYLWQNPYSPLTAGTFYGLSGYTYVPGTGMRITLTNSSFNGPALVTWSDQSGPVIDVNEPYEAWPDWRKLDATEIDAACDVFIWAWRAFQRAWEVTGNDTWKQAARATLEQARIAIDINDGRDWIKPTWADSPFAEGSRFSYADRSPPPGFRVDGYGRVEIAIQQRLSGTGDVQYGKASIGDVYADGDRTTVEVGSNRALTVWCYIDLYQEYSPANRYLAALPLSGAGLQTFTLTRANFTNSSGQALPAGSPVYTAGIYTNNPLAHTLWIKRIRQTPARNIAYYPGAIPFTANFAGSPPMLIDWRGPVYAGYQSPDIWVKTGNSAAAATCAQLLIDAQAAWAAQTGYTAGPFAPVFYFNRDDAVQYGPANTFGWEGPDPNTKWGGYQYRPLAELGVSFAESTVGSAVYAKSMQGLNTFLTWLANDKWWPSFQLSTVDAWASAINHCAALDLPAPSVPMSLAGPPTDFPKTGAEVNYGEPHMTALILRAAVLHDGKLRPNGDASGDISGTDLRIIDKSIMTLDNMWVTSGVMAGTFSNDPAAHEWYGFWHGEILTTLSMTLDWAEKAGSFWKPVADRCRKWIAGMVQWAEAASPVNPSIWGDDYWPFRPDWQQGVSEQFEYSTNIITSTDGHEQRIPRRPGFRRSMVFRHTLTDQAASTQYQAIMSTRQNRPMLVPQWHLPTRVAAAPTGQSYLMLTGTMPAWMKTGGKVLITDHNGRQQLNTIQGVSGLRLGLATSLVFPVTAGDKVYPAWMGLMNPELSSNRKSAAYMQGEVTFLMLPQEDGRTAAVYDGVRPAQFWINMVDLWTKRVNTAANPIFQPLPFDWPVQGILDRFPVTLPVGDDDREVLARKPNWISEVGVTDNWVYEVINYFNGPVIPYTGENRGKRTVQARWSLLTPDDITDFLMLIQRLKGTQYAVWLPSWNADFNLTRDVTAGNTIYVQHNAILDEGLLDLSTVGICINTKLNGLLCARVTSWSVGGVETVLTLDRDIPVDVPLGEVAKVSLLWRVRQASDKAELTWLTDQVAEVQMSFITVQD